MTSIFGSARLSHLAAVIAAGSSLAIAAPAQADPSDTVARAPTAAAANGQRARSTRVCRQVELTGTRVARRVCRTPQEWQEMMEDPRDN